MNHQTRNFTVANPKFFDGDCFEVAERAILQAAAVQRVFLEALEGARLVARNAELERELLVDGECDASAWDDSLQGRKFAQLKREAEQAVRTLDVLAKAAAYNPRVRP